MNYRSYVGPEDLYDVMGGLQFVVLYELGLRENHTLLDIGCGSLRAGRLFIPYLNPSKYFGIEPFKTLVADGIANNLGDSIYDVKTPNFRFNDQFTFAFRGDAPQKGFDYILAQSIFSHATRSQIAICMHCAAEVMHKNSIFVATYFNATNGEDIDYPTEWTYPSVVRHPYLFMKKVANKVGLTLDIMHDTPHPVGQTWILLRKVQ